MTLQRYQARDDGGGVLAEALQMTAVVERRRGWGLA